MPGSVRAFVAVDVDERLRRQVARVQAAFQADVSGAKWVDPALCHITLKFLGHVPEERLAAVADGCRSATGSGGSFQLDFHGIGAFPRWRGARVLWMGIGTGQAALAALQSAVEKALNPLGFQPEGRPFSPHLTLARFKHPTGRALEAIAPRFEHQRFGSVRIDELRLMRSNLRPSGPIYTVLEAFPLGAR